MTKKIYDAPLFEEIAIETEVLASSVEDNFEIGGGAIGDGEGYNGEDSF